MPWHLELIETNVAELNPRVPRLEHTYGSGILRQVLLADPED